MYRPSLSGDWYATSFQSLTFKSEVNKCQGNAEHFHVQRVLWGPLMEHKVNVYSRRKPHRIIWKEAGHRGCGK